MAVILFLIIPIFILLFGISLLSWIIGIIRNIIYFIIEKLCKLFSIPYKKPIRKSNFRFYSSYGNSSFRNATHNQEHCNTKNKFSDINKEENKKKIFSRDEGEYVNFEEL